MSNRVIDSPQPAASSQDRVDGQQSPGPLIRVRGPRLGWPLCLCRCDLIRLVGPPSRPCPLLFYLTDLHALLFISRTCLLIAPTLLALFHPFRDDVVASAPPTFAHFTISACSPSYPRHLCSPALQLPLYTPPSYLQPSRAPSSPIPPSALNTKCSFRHVAPCYLHRKPRWISRAFPRPSLLHFSAIPFVSCQEPCCIARFVLSCECLY